MTNTRILTELIEECLLDGFAEEYTPHTAAKLMANHLVANGVTDINVGNGWISVSDALPKTVKMSRVGNNTYRRSGRVLCACLQSDGKRMVKEGYMEFFNNYPEPNWIIPGTIHSVTHWMPLPVPPKGVE